MNIYQIKITLRHVRPPVWRRILVPADTKLPKLHRILQNVMGWEDAHLHAFRMGNEQYGVPDDSFPGMFRNEKNVRLDQLAGVGGRFVYEYDFGDCWEHDILVEKSLPAGKDTRYPVCTKGKGACPPEDCGGPPGYEHLLEVLHDPRHEEHGRLREWIGEDFDTAAFDLDEVNEGLRRVR
jgi:hypothetical protein